MSFIKTNTKQGDARERTRNLENMTIMGIVNSNLQTQTSTSSDILHFDNNKLRFTNNHTSLLKVTKGYYNLEPCCDLPTMTSGLEDGLASKINVNMQSILSNSSCNRRPLYDVRNDRVINPDVKKNNFNYPIPLSKNTCCSQDKFKPPAQPVVNHTKFLPVMSKIKKYRSVDNTSIPYPDFTIVNENNLVGYFNNVYKTSTGCSSRKRHSTNTGHKWKYTETNCGCSMYDDYIMNNNTHTTNNTNTHTTNTHTTNTTIYQDTLNASFFSRKWMPSNPY